MLLVDEEIANMCEEVNRYAWFADRPLINPIAEAHSTGVISYGLTSTGYDMRLDREVYVYKNTKNLPVDPKLFKVQGYKEMLFDVYSAEPHEAVTIPGNTYILVQSLEEFSLPWWLSGTCVGKSTYARCGIIVNTTPLEPEWYGHLTIEIHNANPGPVKLYVYEGIAQVRFEKLERRPRQTYADKDGKYQGQVNVTPARMK